MRRFLITITFLLTLALYLGACSDDTKQNEDNDKVGENESTESQDSENEKDSMEKTDDNSDSVSESKSDNDSNEPSSKENNDSGNKVNSVLSNYSSEEIEYARIWLQLGANQDIDKIYAQQILAGEPLNADDESTIDYPEELFSYRVVA